MAQTSVKTLRVFEPGQKLVLRGVEYRYIRLATDTKVPSHVLLAVEGTEKNGSKERTVADKELQQDKWELVPDTGIWHRLDLAITAYGMAAWTVGDCTVEASLYGINVKQIAEHYGLAETTLSQYASVCRSFPPDTRKFPKLTLSHYSTVMALPHSDAVELLSKAEELGTKVKELRAWNDTRRAELKEKADKEKEKNGSSAVSTPVRGRPKNTPVTPNAAKDKTQTNGTTPPVTPAPAPDTSKQDNTDAVPPDTNGAGNHGPVSIINLQPKEWPVGYRLIVPAPLSAEFRATFRPNGSPVDVQTLLETAIRGMIDNYVAEQKANAVKNAAEFKQAQETAAKEPIIPDAKPANGTKPVRTKPNGANGTKPAKNGTKPAIDPTTARVQNLEFRTDEKKELAGVA